MRGYKEKTSFANLVIKQNNNYDIGFTWNGFEYQLVADLQFWQQPWSVESFLDKVSQRYAYNSIIKATEKQGFETVEEVNQDNGTIRLTLQRWNNSITRNFIKTSQLMGNIRLTAVKLDLLYNIFNVI